MHGSAHGVGLIRFGWQSFRHLQPAAIEPDSRINVVHGRNAAGKTSLLEALHFLARAKSFLTHRTARVIPHGARAAIVNGEIGTPHGGHRLGVRHGDGETVVRLDGRDVSVLSEAAWLLPLQVINTEAQRLLTDGPAGRRAFLNWGVFHVEPRYRDEWRRYQRALKQRNAALRNADLRLAAACEPEMVHAAAAVDARRHAFLQTLMPAVMAMAADWLPGLRLDWQYRRGWRRDADFAALLASAREREVGQGFSLYGPHRGDLRLTADEVDAASHLSRGQQKLLVAALRLGLVDYWSSRSAQRPVILIDDLPAELDGAHRQGLVQRLEQGTAQVFVTAIEPEQLPGMDDARWFHVEQGRVTRAA